MSRNWGRCQLCGRRRRLNKKGDIARHRADGNVCRGSGEAPFEESCVALEEALARLKRRYQALLAVKEKPGRRRDDDRFERVVVGMMSIECRLKLWRRTHGRRIERLLNQ